MMAQHFRPRIALSHSNASQGPSAAKQPLDFAAVALLFVSIRVLFPPFRFDSESFASFSFRFAIGHRVIHERNDFVSSQAEPGNTAGPLTESRSVSALRPPPWSRDKP